MLPIPIQSAIPLTDSMWPTLIYTEVKTVTVNVEPQMLSAKTTSSSNFSCRHYHHVLLCDGSCRHNPHVLLCGGSCRHNHRALLCEDACRYSWQLKARTEMAEALQPEEVAEVLQPEVPQQMMAEVVEPDPKQYGNWTAKSGK